MRAARADRAGGRRRGGRWKGPGLAACAACAVWSGCSIERNYNVLSFFFDGVPNPAALKHASPAERQAAMRQSATYSVHRPYAEEKCAECHVGFQITTTADARQCVKCHTGKTDQHAFMHGPVAASACLWCHAPHESAYPSLLKTAPRDVCVQCHTPAMLETAKVPAHSDPKASCIECHSGHGGEVRFFLRQPAASAAPPGD